DRGTYGVASRCGGSGDRIRIDRPATRYGLHAAKSSFRNEGTRSLTTNAVGIRRQAGRGADGRRAVDRFGRVVGTGRAAVAGAGAALSLSGSQAAAGSAGAAGDFVRVAHGDGVDASAERA